MVGSREAKRDATTHLYSWGADGGHVLTIGTIGKGVANIVDDVRAKRGRDSLIGLAVSLRRAVSDPFGESELSWMNSHRRSPDDIAELHGDFGDDQWVDRVRFRFFGQHPMVKFGKRTSSLPLGGASLFSLPGPGVSGRGRSTLTKKVLRNHGVQELVSRSSSWT